MGYRRSTGYSPYFLLYGREPLFQARIQHLENDMIDPQTEGPQKLKSQLAYRGAVLQNVMPLAMRNMAIAQQRDEECFRPVRSGGYDRPKATFAVVVLSSMVADRHQWIFRAVILITARSSNDNQITKEKQ